MFQVRASIHDLPRLLVACLIALPALAVLPAASTTAQTPPAARVPAPAPVPVEPVEVGQAPPLERLLGLN